MEFENCTTALINLLQDDAMLVALKMAHQRSLIYLPERS